MNRPIILDNVVVRSGGNDKTFEYDYSKDMNVVKKGDFSIPFIEFVKTKKKARLLIKLIISYLALKVAL
jgi:hypothetical protein